MANTGCLFWPARLVMLGQSEDRKYTLFSRRYALIDQGLHLIDILPA